MSNNGLIAPPYGAPGVPQHVRLQVQSPFLERIAMALEQIAKELAVVRAVHVSSMNMAEGEIK